MCAALLDGMLHVPGNFPGPSPAALVGTSSGDRGRAASYLTAVNCAFLLSTVSDIFTIQQLQLVLV